MSEEEDDLQDLKSRNFQNQPINLNDNQNSEDNLKFKTLCDKIELLSTNLEFPSFIAINSLIENFEKTVEVIDKSVKSMQEIIVHSQPNQEESQKMQQMAEIIFDIFTFFPTSIRDLKNQPEFQILEVLQQLSHEIEIGDRLTMKNLLQIKLQTSYQETFFKERELQEINLNII
jgi:formyltetrahydrofolate synthetase